MTKPEQLSPLNQEAWDLWVDYRKNILKKPLRPANYANTMRGLQRFGADQLAVVRQSMECEYQGLFPLKNRDTTFDPTTFNPEAAW